MVEKPLAGESPLCNVHNPLAAEYQYAAVTATPVKKRKAVLQ